FTLTNEKAMQAIASVQDVLGDKLIVGAGSVMTPQQVDEARQYGAEFIVSPTTKVNVIEACHACHLPVMPGAYTPTEIQSAWELDVAAVKVFPARNLGAAYIKDVLAPLPHLKLLPTGGISATNIAEFIDAGVFAVGLGSSLCNKTVVAAQDWQQITAAARELREAIS
ncbi:MAG: bifunctional 4-hydroxy-2-oxoglutarate aldolase/2-dehydro-3-deoxy-phosphogluconate aldolase, partial [Aggregatilineales bacterium]